MCHERSRHFHLTRLGSSLYLRRYRRSFLFKSGTQVNTPAGNDIVLDIGKPRLPLVDPGRVDGGEVHVTIAVGRQQLVNPFGLVGQGVPGDCPARHFARPGGEGGVPRGHAVAETLQAVPRVPPSFVATSMVAMTFPFLNVAVR